MAVVNQYKFVGIDNSTSGSALTPLGSGIPAVNETIVIDKKIDKSGQIETKIDRRTHICFWRHVCKDREHKKPLRGN